VVANTVKSLTGEETSMTYDIKQGSMICLVIYIYLATS